MKIRNWHINHHILLGVFAGIMLSGQLYGQNCDHDISTDPDSPVNEEMELEFPSLTNPWLSSFDFGEHINQTFSPIELNPTAGWQVPDWTKMKP